MPTPQVSNARSRFAASRVRGSQRGHVAHWLRSAAFSGRGRPSLKQVQGLAFAAKQNGCGMIRVGASQWQVTTPLGLVISHPHTEIE